MGCKWSILLKLQERQANPGATNNFFDDFTDFYKNPSGRTIEEEQYQQGGKEFGSSDGFPNFFEGTLSHPKRCLGLKKDYPMSNTVIVFCCINLV